MTMTTDKQNKVLNVPNLRFPEFTGEWALRRLGDDCEIQMCKRIFAHQTSESGDVPFYKIGTIGGIADAFISRKLFEEYKSKYNYPQKGEVLITCAGTVGKTVVYNGVDAYYQDSNIVWISNPKQYYINSFLHYILSRIDWSKLNTTTIVRIYNDNLRDLTISHPSIKEQDKIVSLLSLIDERIATQSRIIDKLQSLMVGIGERLLYSETGENVKLGGIISERVEKTTENNQYEILSSTVKGIFLQRDYFSKDIASENNIGYKVVRLNDIVLSPQNLWMGNINYNAKFQIGAVSPSYKIFTVAERFYKPFIAAILKTHRALYNYELVSEQGASIVRRNLNMEAFEQITFKIPSYDRQVQIGNAISTLQQRIDLTKNSYSALIQQKQWLLQRMFI